MQISVFSSRILIMSATLGGLIKDYRLQKNISQLEVSFALGWIESSRLSRIEQGITQKPKREIIDAIIKALRLNRNERGKLLRIGGYLPTTEEIEATRSETKNLLEQWKYPVFIVDFGMRLLAWNQHASQLYGITGKIAEHTYKNTPFNFEFLFNPEFFQNSVLSGIEKEKWQQVLLNKLIRFRLTNQNNSSEKWYQDLFKTMIRNELFYKLWQQAQLQNEEIGISNYEYKSLVDRENQAQRLDFHILRSSLASDNRYELNYHVPANIQTFKKYL